MAGEIEKLGGVEERVRLSALLDQPFLPLLVMLVMLVVLLVVLDQRTMAD